MFRSIGISPARPRGTRIEASTDAAFAFAVSLPMIGRGHVPANIGEWLDALGPVPGYAASLALPGPSRLLLRRRLQRRAASPGAPA